MSSMGQVECVAGSSAGGLIARGCAAVRPSHIMSPPHTHVLNPAWTSVPTLPSCTTAVAQGSNCTLKVRCANRHAQLMRPCMVTLRHPELKLNIPPYLGSCFV